MQKIFYWNAIAFKNVGKNNLFYIKKATVKPIEKLKIKTICALIIGKVWFLRVTHFTIFWAKSIKIPVICEGLTTPSVIKALNTF